MRALPTEHRSGGHEGSCHPLATEGWRRSTAHRYILTDVGGVSFGVGLDNGTDGEADEATLLEEKTYQIRWVQLAGPEPVFEFVDELMIEGIRGLQVP
jgi:hypothetical protein